MIFRVNEFVQFLWGNERVGFHFDFGRIAKIRNDSYLIIDKYGGWWDIPKDNKGLKIVGF
jgi:hypothetical protein